MRVLVTGGAGMVGSHVAEYYHGLGWEVTILDNLMRSKLFEYDKESVEFNWNYLVNLGIKCVKGDVRIADDIDKALGEGVDLVIHCAGQPGVPSSVRMPREDFMINAWGTVNVLEAVRGRCPEACFIYCSTNKVFGENVDSIPLVELDTRYDFKGVLGVNENMLTDLTGHTPYGVSKLTGDLYVQEYGKIYGMNTGVFRMSCIYGTRQFGFEDQGWVSWFIIASLFNKPVTIFGDGKQVRDMLWADDLVRLFDTFRQSGVKTGVFNAGGGRDNTISLLEFVNILYQKTGKRLDLKFKDWRPSDQKVYITDISKAKGLGWSPTTNINDGIDNIIRWINENPSYFSLS